MTKDIYVLNPINKSTSVVTSQSGCTSHDGLSDEQIRSNLVSRWQWIQRRLEYLPKRHPERKSLGKEQQDIQKKLSSIRPKRKFDRGLNDYIIDIIKKRYTKVQWHALVEEAEKQFNKDKKQQPSQNSTLG